MLSQEEHADVIDRLLEVVSGFPSPRASLAGALYPELRGRLQEGEPRVLVERAVAICNDDGYRNAPPAMVRLLDTLLPGELAIAGIVERLAIAPPAPPDPFGALVLVSKLPFIERSSTRAALKLLLDPIPTRPVVVVNGPRNAGKTYTGDFVDHVLFFHPDVRHCRIELDEHQGPSTGPQELASDMVTQMGGRPSTAPPQNTNLVRWAQELANWVISVANESAVNWWFVLDGFNEAELRADTQLLIEKLAKGVTTGIARQRHRLVLTDFDRAVLPLQPGLIAAETTAPIPHESIAAVVEELVAHSALPLDVPVITARVLDGLPDPVADLSELSLQLSDLIASVEG